MRYRNLTEFGATAGDLQQAQYDVLLVLAHDQVVGLEEEALDDSQSAPAPGYEVGDVVSSEECARLGAGEGAHQG